MKNLLNSTDIATLFLDKELNIRRYTDQATKIFKLIKSDIGRPFTDLVSDLEYPELAADGLEVLRTLVFIQKQIPTKDGRWFSTRIMPYRTLDDRIEGLVITFIDISGLIQAEARLLEKEQVSRLALNSSPDIIILLSPGWTIKEFNSEAELFFGKKRENVIDQNFIHLFVPGEVHQKTLKDLTRHMKADVHRKLTMQVLTVGGRKSVAEWTVTAIFNNLKIATGLMITKRK